MYFEIPEWIQIFVMVGIGTLFIVIPIRIFYEETKGSRDRAQRVRDLADRLRERFGEVMIDRSFLGPATIRFTHEERSVLIQPDDKELRIQLEPKISPTFHAIVRTRGWLSLPFKILWSSFRILPRIRTTDSVLDEGISIYSTPVFGNYVRDLALDGLPSGGKPAGLAESLIVLRNMPGVRWFEVRVTPGGGFRVRFKLRAEDLIYRADELESAIHHAFRLYELMVLI